MSSISSLAELQRSCIYASAFFLQLSQFSFNSPSLSYLFIYLFYFDNNVYALFVNYRSAGAEIDSHSSSHRVIQFLITTLGAYLQLQYQSQKKSPLEEHRNIMIAIYVNLFLYGMSLMAESKLKTCCGSTCLSIVKTFTLLFRILVIVLIMIILYPILRFVASIIWALITMGVVIKLFREILQWLRPIFIHGKDVVTSYFYRTENSSLGIQGNGSATMEANDISIEIELPV